MIMFFLFFATISMTSTGMQAFSVAALVTLHDMPVASASAALTIYLFCSAGGILVGGEISDRTRRHDAVAAVVFVASAGISLLLAWLALPLVALARLMAVMGLGQGIIRPARDMMLRAAAPKGSAGTAFGFVSAGISVGSAVAPIPFGWLLDSGRPAFVFYLIAAFMRARTVSSSGTGRAGGAARDNGVSSPPRCARIEVRGHLLFRLGAGVLCDRSPFLISDTT